MSFEKRYCKVCARKNVKVTLKYSKAIIRKEDRSHNHLSTTLENCLKCPECGHSEK